ncbi:MAG: FeoB-associated Cys-rich membrane protein [Draconibacterium sp.]
MWEFQNIVVYIVVLSAVLWLVKKLFWKKRGNHSGTCGNTECGCH